MQQFNNYDELLKWVAIGTLAILAIVSVVFYYLNANPKDTPLDKPIIDKEMWNGWCEFNSN
jgi:hypothetical protein